MTRFNIMAAVHHGRTTDIVQLRPAGTAGLVRPIAAKRLRPEFRGNAALEQAFLSEARVGVALAHQNLVTVLAASRERWQIDMEFLRGWNLKQVQDRTGASVALPIDVAIAIAAAVGQGLAHMHAQGMAHRHLTPGNIMITAEGASKIIDFGAATIGSQKRPASRYTAPEFFTRRAELDARGDTYSLGAILFELTTGHRLFVGGRDSMQQIVAGRRPLASVLDPAYPKSLELIVNRAMALDPEDRFENISDMLDALEDFAALGDFSPNARLVARFTSRWTTTPVRVESRRARGTHSEVHLRSDVEVLTLADLEDVVDDNASHLEITRESIPQFAGDTVEV